MLQPAFRTYQIAATGLAICVITQLAYLALGASGTPLATDLWQAEAAAFLAVALAGGALLARMPVVGAGLAVGGLLNVAQVGIGLTLFEPLDSGGEPFAAIAGGVVTFAFFLYFAGKAAFGVAGAALGWRLWRGAHGAKRWLGAAAGVSGLAALAINLPAMASGMALVFPAGAMGTLAAALLVVALLLAREAATE